MDKWYVVARDTGFELWGETAQGSKIKNKINFATMEIWPILPGWKRSNSELQDGICRINNQ